MRYRRHEFEYGTVFTLSTCKQNGVLVVRKVLYVKARHDNVMTCKMLYTVVLPTDAIGARGLRKVLNREWAFLPECYLTRSPKPLCAIVCIHTIEAKKIHASLLSLWIISMHKGWHLHTTILHVCPIGLCGLC